jgi:CheY-like chemotaxis protein
LANTVQTVLVVDDDSDVRMTLEALLQEYGFEVLTAEDGNRALQKLSEHAIDLVLLDVIMPDKDGLETLTLIKRSRPDVRVVSMSGGGQRRNGTFLAAAKQCGADAIIAKPIEPGDLVRVIRQSLAGKLGPPAAAPAARPGPRYVARPHVGFERLKRH